MTGVYDGEYLEWLGAKQGLRQGGVLSPVVFNIFFAATITVVALQHLRAGTDILADLVHLEVGVPQDVGTEDMSAKKVIRVAWGMLYAGVVSRSL